MVVGDAAAGSRGFTRYFHDDVLCRDYFSCHSVDIVLVFYSVCRKFQFKNRRSVIVIKFFVRKNRVRRRDVCLSQRDFLRLFQSDIGRWFALTGVDGVVIAVVNGYDAGGKLQFFNGVLGALAHIRQKIIAWKHRTRFQLQDNVLLVPIDIF